MQVQMLLWVSYLTAANTPPLLHVCIGQFGKVYKATLMLGSRVTVAVKTIRRYTSEKERQDFMREMAIMAQMMHPNIIQLYGLVNEGWQSIYYDF